MRLQLSAAPVARHDMDTQVIEAPAAAACSGSGSGWAAAEAVSCEPGILGMGYSSVLSVVGRVSSTSTAVPSDWIRLDCVNARTLIHTIRT